MNILFVVYSHTIFYWLSCFISSFSSAMPCSRSMLVD